jgi:superfamily II DNA or RNA helicase
MNLDVIHENEVLSRFIRSGDWMKSFDNATLKRAKPYASSNLIYDLEIKDQLNVGYVSIECRVRGTAATPYKLMIQLTVRGKEVFIQSACSCPVAYSCKHTAAVFIYLAKILIHGGDSAVVPMPHELLSWLSRVKKSSVISTVKTPENKPKAENRFVAYCIEKLEYEHDYHFSLRTGTRRKDGTCSITKTQVTTDLSRPPKYVTDEDRPHIINYLALKKISRSWDYVSVKGKGWGDFLLNLAAEGRLFFGLENPTQDSMYRYNRDFIYASLKLGGEEWFYPDWEILERGSMMPVIGCANPNAYALPIRPMLYFDLASKVIGKVASELGEDFLEEWNDGPMISKGHLDEVSKHFEEVPTKQIPPPKALSSIEHEATLPSACLSIGKFGGSYRGRLNVRYENSPALEPLQDLHDVSFTLLHEGSRHVWKRNGKAEMAFSKKMASLGFVAGEPKNEYRISPQVFHEAMPSEPLPEGALAERVLWARFLDSEAAQALRDENWEIVVDSKAGLTVHDVSDFAPEMDSESDHGIDWFRFDVPFEFHGKKLSLIPIIANAIREGLPAGDDPNLPEYLHVPCENPEEGMLRFPAKRLIEIVEQVRHLFYGRENADGPIRMDRLAAAGVADALSIDGSATLRSLAQLGKNLRTLTSLPELSVPPKLKAKLREYQQDGFRWLQFLSDNGLHGILADDMGLGKTIQTLAHLAAEREKKPGRPSLVIAPTSVVPNWGAEAEKFTPHLKTVVLQGKDRSALFPKIKKADLVVTSYPLLAQDFEILKDQDWHVLILDEAQYIKNSKALTTRNACKLNAANRICLSGTPMENHLGELWSLMRFLMPGFLSDEKTFNNHLRKPIERDRSTDAQLALNRRVAPLILRRTKNDVAKDLPEKTEIIHHIDLNDKQTDLYETVRAAMDERVRDAIHEKGLAKSHIIVLDALLKLRQICCHPKLLKLPAAQKIEHSAKLDFLCEELLPTLIEEGRRILLFSTFTSMLAIIEKHLSKRGIPYLIITGQTKERASLVKQFQNGEVPIFLISLKAGGTGLNLTAADTVIHYDPWWNPAAENQATDRAHRIGQKKPVFVHKLVCRGSIEERMLELQKHKSGLVEALLSEETSKLRIDPETLGQLLAPIHDASPD